MNLSCLDETRRGLSNRQQSKVGRVLISFVESLICVLLQYPICKPPQRVIFVALGRYNTLGNHRNNLCSARPTRSIQSTAKMCWDIRTLDYLCGHETQPNHSIPEWFVRACNQTQNPRSDRCQTIHSRILQETIPWLCPECHWSIIGQGLGPLYATAIQTGQSTIYKLAETFVEGQSPGVIAIDNQLRRAIQQTTESILLSGSLFHSLGAQALRGFLGAVAFQTFHQEARNGDHPWSAISTQDSRNPFQRLALPDASSGIHPGWTLGPNPQARVEPAPSYSGDPNSFPHSAPVLASTSYTPLSRPPTAIEAVPPPDYDLLHPWTSADLERVRQPHPIQDRVVREGDSSDSSLDDDSPATILTRELRRKRRALIEIQNMPQPDSRRNLEWANGLGTDISEFELLAREEQSIENIVGQLEPLIRDLNSRRRSGPRNDEESGSLLRERIDRLYQRLDIINIDRATRGAPVGCQFPLNGSTRELVFIRDQGNSGQPFYNDSHSSQAEHGSARDDENESVNEPDDVYDGDAEDSNTGPNVSYGGDDTHREQQSLSEQSGRQEIADLRASQSRIRADLETVSAYVASLYPGVQNSTFLQQLPPPQQVYSPLSFSTPPPWGHPSQSFNLAPWGHSTQSLPPIPWGHSALSFSRPPWGHPPQQVYAPPQPSYPSQSLDSSQGLYAPLRQPSSRPELEGADATTSRLQTDFHSTWASLWPAYLTSSSDVFAPQRSQLPHDEDVMMGEATPHIDQSDLIE